MNMNLAIEALQDYFSKTIISKNKIDQVQQIVANHYNIKVEDLKSKKRFPLMLWPYPAALRRVATSTLRQKAHSPSLAPLLSGNGCAGAPIAYGKPFIIR